MEMGPTRKRLLQDIKQKLQTLVEEAFRMDTDTLRNWVCQYHPMARHGPSREGLLYTAFQIALDDALPAEVLWSDPAKPKNRKPKKKAPE